MLARALGCAPLGFVGLGRRRQRILDRLVEAFLSAGFVFGEGFVGHDASQANMVAPAS